MSSRVMFWFVFAISIALASPVGNAQRGPSTRPMIVIFHEDAPLAAFEARYRADDRAQSNPAAWGYLRRDVAGAVQALEARAGFRADHVYSHAVKGFAARLTASQIADLANDPFVDYIEADGIMEIVAQTLPWGINKIDADISSTRAGNGSGTISNVNVYVIDTGIASHADLNRVGHVNFASGQNTDCHGHGTHVAGTAAARDNASDVVGVAPGAPLTGVKVLGCSGSGTTSGVIKGVDYVTANAKKPAVANMSLGGGASTALDDAVRRSAAFGVFYAIAAGNSAANACNSSPARAGAGTTSHHDRRRNGFGRSRSVVEQLRQLRGHLGAGGEHPLDPTRRWDDNHVRHVDGIAAWRRRRGTLSVFLDDSESRHDRTSAQVSSGDDREQEQGWSDDHEIERRAFLISWQVHTTATGDGACTAIWCRSQIATSGASTLGIHSSPPPEDPGKPEPAVCAMLLR